MRVALDPARLAASGVTPGEVAMALQGANARLQAGEFATPTRCTSCVSARRSRPWPIVGSVVVATRGGAPVYLRNVAAVAEEYGEHETTSRTPRRARAPRAP